MNMEGMPNHCIVSLAAGELASALAPPQMSASRNPSRNPLRRAFRSSSSCRGRLDWTRDVETHLSLSPHFLSGVVTRQSVDNAEWDIWNRVLSLSFSFDQQESSSLDETTRFSPSKYCRRCLHGGARTVSLLNPNNAAISMMHKKALASAVAERSSE